MNTLKKSYIDYLNINNIWKNIIYRILLFICVFTILYLRGFKYVMILQLYRFIIKYFNLNDLPITMILCYIIIDAIYKRDNMSITWLRGFKYSIILQLYRFIIKYFNLIDLSITMILCHITIDSIHKMYYFKK